jgi:hypothetical protein
MNPNKHNIPERHIPRSSGRFTLFFYEKVGPRYYLRFTNLALILIVCLTVIPIVLLFSLYLSRQPVDSNNVNVNIMVPTPAPHDYSKPIFQPPLVSPPTSPKVSKQPGANAPVQQTPLVSNGNSNKSSNPSPTPSPILTRPPT